MLKERGRNHPLENYQLSFYNVSDSMNRKALVTFDNPSEQMNEHLIKLHFESFTAKGSVEEVQFLPHDKACVIFKDPQSKPLAIECYKIKCVTIIFIRY